MLAKEAATIDLLSSGRFELGIGAGWAQPEYKQAGIPFDAGSIRVNRLEEALQICRAMFREEAPSFEGRYYQIHGAVNSPRPIQPNGPPIMIGGGGEQRTLKLVAQYADMCNIFGDAAMVRHKMDVLERHCETVGRDPGKIAYAPDVDTAVSMAIVHAARIGRPPEKSSASMRLPKMDGTPPT